MVRSARRKVLQWAIIGLPVLGAGCAELLESNREMPDLEFQNRTESSITASFIVTYPPGEEVLSDEFRLQAGESREYHFSEGGDFHIEIQFSDGRAETFEWSDPNAPEESDNDVLTVSIYEDDIRISKQGF